MINCNIDMAPFERHIQEAETCIEASTVQMTREMANVWVGQAWGATPPAAKGIRQTEARKRQEARIYRDLFGTSPQQDRIIRTRAGLVTAVSEIGDRGAVSPFVLFKGKLPKGAQVCSNPRAHLSQFKFRRRQKGMFLSWHGPRPFVTESALRVEYKRRVGKVGRLAAGWLAGALLAGRKSCPAYIRRHGAAEGHAHLSKSLLHGAWMIISNRVPYHRRELGNLISVIEAKADRAMKKRAENILKWELKKHQEAA